VASEIIYDKSDGTDLITLPKYDYFSGGDIEFYTGKNIEIIDHYIDDKGKDRYIWTNENEIPMEILPHGKNFKTEPAASKVYQNWEKKGNYVIYNGMRKNKNIFDHSNPKILESSTMYLNDYDKQYFDGMSVESIKNYLSGVSLVRNEQLICRLSLDTFTSNTSRGNGQSMITQFYHRTELKYNTYSSQDNKMDSAMGIQENKTQHEKKFPKDSKPLERLIIYLKNRNLKKIKDYFDNVIKIKED
jgi:hypothetical protein